jgi:hypothetical protein
MTIPLAFMARLALRMLRERIEEADVGQETLMSTTVGSVP